MPCNRISFVLPTNENTKKTEEKEEKPATIN
jgi:hypothetical protein